MIDDSFRRILPKYTEHLVRVYKYLKLTPNQITFIGFIFSCTSAYLIASHLFLAAIFVWWGGRLLDGTDGIYARVSLQTSKLGAFLDILFDMASYSIMILGFSRIFPEFQFQWLIIMFLYVLCITGALALGSLEDLNKLKKNENRGLRLATGIAEGGETGIAYTLFLIFPSNIETFIYLWILILSFTVAARMLLAKKELI